MCPFYRGNRQVIHQKTRTYRIIYQYKDAWKPETFRERYSEVLDQYDYIVGDWGYNQLRLKGFYRPDHPKATKETSIAYLQDYLHEYCNFGCAYFVMEKVDPSDRLNLDLDRPEASITISELPPSQRYEEWQAFLQKLKEQREQEKENGTDDRQARRQNRPSSGDPGGPSAGLRRNEQAVRDRQDQGRPVRLHAAEPGARPGGRHPEGTASHSPAGGTASDGRRANGPGSRQADRGFQGRSRHDHGAAGETRQTESRQTADIRQTDHRPPDSRQAEDRQAENRQPARAGHKRPWHRNRKNRPHGKWDRPRQSGPDPKKRQPDGSASGEPT